MTDDPTARGASAPKGPFWVKVPFEAVKERLLQVHLDTGETYGTVAVAWLETQASAQTLKDGGRFEVSRVRLAHDTGTKPAAIDAIFAAFVELGLIVDNKCATFIPDEKTRDQKYHGKKKAAPASKAPPAPPREADAPLPTGIEDRPALDVQGPDIAESATRIDPSASRIDPSASRMRTESSESTSSTSELRKISRASSSSSSGEAAGATTTTGEEIFSKIVEATDGKIAGLTIRRGLGSIRKLIDEGCDLDLDILPELAEIATFSTSPLRNLAAPFIADQVRTRHGRRIAGLGEPGRQVLLPPEPRKFNSLAHLTRRLHGPPEEDFQAPSNPRKRSSNLAFLNRVAYGPPSEDFEMQALRELSGNG